MTEQVARLADQIRALSAEERADLLDALLIGGPHDAEIDIAWANEAEARLDRYLRGEAASKPAGDILAKHLVR